MKNLFQQINTKLESPAMAGWYHTDKGHLFYFKSEETWSCRSDIVSDEFPRFWYLPVHKENIEPATPESKHVSHSHGKNCPICGDYCRLA
jgi:hypothetical protein